MAKEKSQIIGTIKKVMPAVVSIVISKKLEDLKKELPEMFPYSDYPELQIPPEKIDAHGMVQIGGGSGFLVDGGGIILTNKHVIADPKAAYTIITMNGDRFDAEVLARDPLDDVAILKIKSGKKLPVVQLGSSDNLELGQIVIAFGNALGIFRNTVSTGIISGLSRAISAKPDPLAPAQEMRGLIQTDAAINPGNSGGPLTDIFGKVIGINAAVVFGAQNIGFAIPIKAAERDLKDLRLHGTIRRPFLGLRYLTLNPDLKEKLNLVHDYGALVVKEHPLDQAVVPNSPAARAGLKENDIILEWNGERITPDKNIQDCLEQSEVGQTVSLKVVRNKREFSAKIVLAERKQLS
ncbi:MAG: 2-alkenal reductase [Candidatus Jorgensenbacteria bacterium GW2011_GWA1_48_13]|uniref:2-alkenal reductase n=2 Tax=Candidatus Joergenseniibacteriota TaxID=1752739 RepID=A0A0G1W830_9BACT|nr:MAG: 2-alkenal reductase [Candidatus Jorgensenbacteria bacterium GW2011_GWA1_48_13]KKU98582.1 MAG: Protease Do [Candidatus Jorgensenbacteria bacterium GW2011_GWC1_48_8]KKW14750.1 MAG: 2-alkenal reductase [Candidatus Jorgensenbacteria bacterium GW2011_GWB1_50_10]